MAELQGLRDYAVQAVQDLDRKMQGLAAPKERLTKLLQAQDKKAMLLEMQGQLLADPSTRWSACVRTSLCLPDHPTSAVRSLQGLSVS